MNSIIQWNCRGLKANFDEVSLLLSQHNPIAFCLQETFLKENDDISFKHYNIYNKIFTGGEKASGGVSVIINNRVPHRALTLETNLQAVAVSVTLHKTITVCSLYLPPNTIINKTDLDNLVEQLPSPFVILGDFNGHSPVWGCADSNSRGDDIEDFLSVNNLCLLNDKSHTYLHPASGTYTSIDLSVCSPSIFMDFDWKVDDDLHGSDHFPIFVQNVGPPVLENISRWKLRKADWEKFRSLCEESIRPENFLDQDDPTELFTDLLYDIASKCIPKTSSTPKRAHKPWFDEKCKEAVKERKSALNTFKTKPTSENLNKFRIARARARRTMKQSKKTSWKQYVSKLNSRSSIKKTWDMIRKINGNGRASSVNHIKTSSGNITSAKDISNTLAENFSKKSSTDNYTSEFKKHKAQAEKTKLNFKSDNSESYNKLFSLKELKSALKKSHDTSAGPDEIHYQLLKHLPTTSLKVLLDIYNEVWQTGNFPKLWGKAIVVPIPKPGKDHTDASNYRPIALTSCVCKIMERMVNDRLVWYLESNNLIAKNQSGFRRQRGTNDHLVRFESFIREAFIKKEQVVAVFFDLESAYDTTWKYGIMKDLHDIGLRGRLPTFIGKFLDERYFKVRVGNTLSDSHEQEMGVPQGCILSVTLFSIKINNIVKAIHPGIECFLYVDDFCICYRSKQMHTIERQLQQVINNLQHWSNTNGFKFSKTKTKCMFFCNKRGVHPDPELFLNGSRIEVVPEFKFLGLIFDSKLTFIPHINYLRNKCNKALNLLRVVSNYDWGADRKVLLRLYRSLIRSKLDYGCFVYGSARQSYIKKLDTIHHQGLRLVLGAFRTSPIQSLYAEANEPSLYIRRRKLAMQYFIKLKSNPKNPTYNVVFNPSFKELFLRKPRVIPPFSLRCGADVACLNVDLKSVAEHGVSDTPPWTRHCAIYNYELAADKKASTDPEIFKSKHNEMKDRHPNFNYIYTDGSKIADQVASAAVSEDDVVSTRLPRQASIFSAELKAIDLALDLIEREGYWRYIIFTDSMSAMQALENISDNVNPLLNNILNKISRICEGTTLIFCWLPSHVGIAGNEKADRAAKAALSDEIEPLKIPYNDFKPSINNFIHDVWQRSWSDPGNANNKLYAVKPVISESTLCGMSRREEVVLARLCIGHAYLTHSYLLKREAHPQCSCGDPLTIQHILIHCNRFNSVRRRFYNVSNLKDVLTTHAFKVFEFLKELKLFYKI
jgi:ribonuclease HI